jgi:hypothetical protein
MAVRIWSLIGLVMVWGCTDRELKPLNPCLVSAVSDALLIKNIDKVDLLFMVDNSSSMKEEQTALAVQFPRLIQALTTGDRDLDGKVDFRPAKDLHLGVVSSNMGVAGALTDDPSCDGHGDDGVLLHRATDASLPSCLADAYPSFLSYRADGGDPTRTAGDFGCIAALGTTGCGFEQQLEASLKALWPSLDATGAPHAPPLHGPFLGATGSLQGPDGQGHGDRENAGFLRSGVGTESSLLAIIMVTDEEDCSSGNTHHFTRSKYLPDNDPIRQQENYDQMNLRCFYNKQNLFPVERYIEGFKALRSDPNLVVFGAIVGVPDDLVGQAALANIDFSDAGDRNSFYDGLLSDPRMTEVVDPDSFNVPGKANLKSSCSNASSVAYPPRRIVEVARGMGENALVQSICQSDFTPALDAIVSVIAHKLGALCLPRPLVRNSAGQVNCNMLWELPAKTADAPVAAPTQCGAPGWEFLLPAGERDTPKGPAAVCKVAQLAVRDQGGVKSHGQTDNDGQTFAEGWYYDDYSAALRTSCGAGETRQAIGFSENGVPPSGVTVKLECLNEVQTYEAKRLDVTNNREQPSIGDRCDDVERDGQPVSREDACAVTLTNGQLDRSMFCHPELNVCVLACNSTTDCPPAWVCDSRESTMVRSQGARICVNPTCGDPNRY